MKLLINYDYHHNLKAVHLKLSHGEVIDLPVGEAKELIRLGVAAAINPEEEFSPVGETIISDKKEESKPKPKKKK